VLRIVALLPARVARLVSRAARDFVDAGVESLELQDHLACLDPDAEKAWTGTLGRLLGARRFPCLVTLAFAVTRNDLPAGTSWVPTMRPFLLALQQRSSGSAGDVWTTGTAALRSLEITTTSRFPYVECVTRTLATLPRPLERLHLRFEGLCREEGAAAQLSAALLAMSGGLRDVSLGGLDSRALPEVSRALARLTSLERLELLVDWRSAEEATSEGFWEALAAGGRGELRRLESLRLTSVGRFCDVARFFFEGPHQSSLCRALAALPSLRSLAVDALEPLMPRRVSASSSVLHALAALTHLSVTKHGVYANSLAQLTALRSLHAPCLVEADEELGDGAISALGRLTALTRLQLFDDHDRPLRRAAVLGAPLLPSLRVLDAGALGPLLLGLPASFPAAFADRRLVLPSLTDLTCSKSALFACWRDVCLTSLTSLRALRVTNDDHRDFGLALGRPSDLTSLTSLSATERELRPRLGAAAWLWEQLRKVAFLGPSNGVVDGPTSRLVTLQIHLVDGDLAPLLRGLPALATLALMGVGAEHVRGGRASALTGAFGHLPSLTKLLLTGDAEPVAAVLAAAAACPALRARLEAVDVCWHRSRVSPGGDEANTQLRRREALIRDSVGPFAALREAKISSV